MFDLAFLSVAIFRLHAGLPEREHKAEPFFDSERDFASYRRKSLRNKFIKVRLAERRMFCVDSCAHARFFQDYA